MKSKILIASALFLISFAALADDKVDQIVAEYIEAKGGMEALESNKTMVVKGHMSQGPMEFPWTASFKRPNKLHMEFEVQGMKGVQAYDGTTGWMVMPFMGKTDAEEMADDQLNQIVDQADFDGPLVNYKAKGHTVEYIGETEIEGTPVVELKVTKKNGDVMHFFLDQEYKLEVMTRSKMKQMGQEFEMENYYSNYKEVGNTVIAHSISSRINGVEGQQLTMESIELNTELDDDMFSMPEKAEAAE